MTTFIIHTIRKEQRTYRVQAESLELAEEAVLNGYAEPLAMDIQDEFVHDSREAVA